MTSQREYQGNKAIYTKPTLSEYGSLAERTRIFGLDPESDLGLASVAVLGATVTVTL